MTTLARTSSQDTADQARQNQGRSGRKTAEAAQQRRATQQQRRLEVQVLAEETECWRCGGPVDQSIQGSTHPWGPVILHPKPAWAGGNALDRTNAHLAHRRCKAAYCEQLRAQQRTR
ncbi:hypothetical protein [Streptomyces sp. UG1]|uniref:hypothetical protein n=1 Tax=Streptomyces sp. UG1 TaxID=3417652 RepID=UPI003CF280BA